MNTTQNQNKKTIEKHEKSKENEIEPTAVASKDSKRLEKRKEIGIEPTAAISASETKKQHVADDSKKALLFEKIWTNDDEVVLLKGAIQYIQEKGKEPNSNLQEFYDFISGCLHGVFSKSQVGDKLRRLKKKYANIAKKGKSLSIPQEKILFDLSRSVWENRNKEKKFVQPVEEATNKSSSGLVSGFVVSSVFTEFLKSLNFSFGEDLMKKYTRYIANEEREKKWLEVATGEIELLKTKCELLNEEASAFLEVLKFQSDDF